MFFVKHKFFFVFCHFATIDSLIERAKNSYSTLGKYVLFQCSGADPQWTPFCSPTINSIALSFCFRCTPLAVFFCSAELELEFFCERLLYQRQPSIVVHQIYCLFLSLFKLNSSTLLATCTTSWADKKSVANWKLWNAVDLDLCRISSIESMECECDSLQFSVNIKICYSSSSSSSPLQGPWNLI